VRLRLSPPKVGTLVFALLFGLAGILAHSGPLRSLIPGDFDFWLLAIGFVMLVLGAVFRGI
jgi:hypothetical protein